jgi:hypothetical protein
VQTACKANEAFMLTRLGTFLTRWPRGLQAGRPACGRYGARVMIPG